MLQNSLYYIVRNDQNVYTIRFDASHPIFAGHFPEHPIVPGACLVQIAEELAAATYGHAVRFTALRNLRFSRPIIPNQEVTITIKQTEDNALNFQFLVSNSEYARFTALNECLYR